MVLIKGSLRSAPLTAPPFPAGVAVSYIMRKGRKNARPQPAGPFCSRWKYAQDGRATANYKQSTKNQFCIIGNLTESLPNYRPSGYKTSFLYNWPIFNLAMLLRPSANPATPLWPTWRKGKEQGGNTLFPPGARPRPP